MKISGLCNYVFNNLKKDLHINVKVVKNELNKKYFFYNIKIFNFGIN